MIYVDADSCPVKDLIIDIAKKYNISVTMYFDQSHVYESDYAIVKIVEKGKDSVDLYIVNEIKKKDIVVSQDYGLASMCLSKEAFVITPNGLIISNENIMSLLDFRYLGVMARKSDKHIKGPKKRTIDNDKNFYFNFENIIKKNLV